MESAKRGGLILASLLLLLSVMAVGCSADGPAEAPLPIPPEPILVHLEPGGRVQITLNYDSGIR